MPHPCATFPDCQTEAFEPAPRYEQSGQEREEESRQSLRSLQELICELLIQNQELRMLLPSSTTNHQSEWAE